MIRNPDTRTLVHFYPFHPVHVLGKFTHFMYGMFWVIFQWDDARVGKHREGGSAYGLIFRVKNGLLSSENSYFWEVILDISE